MNGPKDELSIGGRRVGGADDPLLAGRQRGEIRSVAESFRGPGSYTSPPGTETWRMFLGMDVSTGEDNSRRAASKVQKWYQSKIPCCFHDLLS